jgi:hypothetical protein
VWSEEQGGCHAPVAVQHNDGEHISQQHEAGPPGDVSHPHFWFTAALSAPQHDRWSCMHALETLSVFRVAHRERVAAASREAG